MNVLQEIFKWSQDLPPWQSDAIRRIFSTGALSGTDLDDLIALAKANNGIPDPTGRVVQPLLAEHVPVPATTGGTVRLLAIKELKNINAIAPGQTLLCAKSGLTMLYGDNGAGKSGYSRVLKRACRSRDSAERVLPNANLTDKGHGIPEAVFEIEVNGKPHVELWREGKESPPILSSIAVFDLHCARVYLDDEKEVAFIPYGLDIPSGLASACVTIKQRLQQDAASLTFNPLNFKDLEGDTDVGRATALLPNSVSPETFKRLGTLSPQEIERLPILREALKQPDPAARAKVLSHFKERLDIGKNKAKKLCSSLSDEKLALVNKADQEWRAAVTAAKLAAQELANDPHLLPGTGNEVWKRLFDAAREYSEQCAYPDHAFPHTENGARCPLCQQELTEGVEHLKRFDVFIKNATEKTAEAMRQNRERIIADFREIDISPLLDVTTLAEAKELNSTIADLLERLSRLCVERHVRVLAACDSGAWSGTSEPPLPSYEPAIEEFLVSVQAQIDALTEAASADRAKIEVELRELEARQRLMPRLQAVLEAIEREKLRQAIVQCAQSINTYGISSKATELTEKAVTKELEQALNREFQNLQAENLRVVLTARTTKGATRHKLRLEMPTSFELAKVLSEGEQRAIAIASFLAEANITPGNETLVFDDPVSSLDHVRREVVAKRLAVEATKRQVIVLTHDLYFLNLLLQEAEENDLSPLTQMVVRGIDGPGTVIQDLPFQGKGTKARIGQLKQLHQQVDKLWREKSQIECDRLVRDGYRMLRDSWERAVEEILFNRTVERFKKSIETKRLSQVLIEPKDQDEIEKGMTRCSNFTHDNPLMAGITIPTPAEFLVDVEALEAFRVRVETRRQKKPA